MRAMCAPRPAGSAHAGHHALHAAHHFLQIAALELLHHGAHLLVLVEHAVHFLNLHARARRDAALARGLDEFGLGALGYAISRRRR